MGNMGDIFEVKREKVKSEYRLGNTQKSLSGSGRAYIDRFKRINSNFIYR